MATRRISGEPATASKPARSSPTTDGRGPAALGLGRTSRATSGMATTNAAASAMSRVEAPAAAVIGPAASVPTK